MLPVSRLPALRWPLPALLAWAACWSVVAALRAADVPEAIALAVAGVAGALCSVLGATPWRRVFIAGGFPLSAMASGLAGSVPAWAWLAPLAALALVYPLRTWGDAPVFPTPRGALRGLAASLALAPTATILDAGCGLGAALRELRREFPRARLDGIEWSRPLRLLCAWRCRDATVRRGDMWALDWSDRDLVYVFQRPESMERVVAKAAQELADGAWLASLEFEATTLRPTRVFTCADGRPLYLYRLPFASSAQAAASRRRA